MRTIITVLSLTALLFSLGCTAPSENRFLSVDIPENKPLTYKFTTNREVELNLKGDDAGKKSEKEQSTTEGAELIITYTPKETDVYGDITLEAECKSVKINRKSLTSRSQRETDALKSLEGKKWQFVVNSAGEIQDYSEMDKLVKELGEKSINTAGKRRIKSPDLIWDFVTTQWFMWDAVSSNNKLSAGLQEGQSWESALPVPFAVRIPAERAVEYTVEQTSEDISQVVISSKYNFRGYEEEDGKLKFKSALSNMPSPYEGKYQTKGMFGFLRDYKAEELSGTGRSVYDAKRGVLLSQSQQYQMKLSAAFLFPLGDTTPVLDVVQTIEVELIDE